MVIYHGKKGKTCTLNKSKSAGWAVMRLGFGFLFNHRIHHQKLMDFASKNGGPFEKEIPIIGNLETINFLRVQPFVFAGVE